MQQSKFSEHIKMEAFLIILGAGVALGFYGTFKAYR